MTYWNFLTFFLIIPIVFLSVIAAIDLFRGKKIPQALRAKPYWMAVVLHMVIAPLYTFIWDNYLVASRVWWYDPNMVSGKILWWVPVEEYVFFILQPLLGGLWILFVMRRVPFQHFEIKNQAAWRRRPLTGIFILWLLSIAILGSTWENGSYLALQLVWVLPPVALQVFFGGDILRRYSKLVLLNIMILTLYLSVADYLAIRAGTWSINPQKSLNIFIGGSLPLEEFLFFLLTNTMITFGIILFISSASWERFRQISQKLKSTAPAAQHQDR